MNERKLVRVQEKGQVTLPAEARRKLGIKKGDLVAVMETPGGVLITPQQALPAEALDRISRILTRQGVSLNELLAAGPAERERLWQTVDRVRQRNADKDPNAILVEVTAEVDAVRQERYGRRRRHRRHY